MPELKIPLNSGIDNFADGEEVGHEGNLDVENLYTHIPGKATLRPYVNNEKVLNDIKVYSITPWKNDSLAEDNGFAWIVTGKWIESDNEALWKCNRDFTSIEQIYYGSTPHEVTILDNVAIFNFGAERRLLRYKYIDQSFFDDLFTFKDWFLDTAQPINNFAMFTNVVTHGDEDTGYLSSSKHYFYKVVPVFDGTQMCPLPTPYVHLSPNNDNSFVEVNIELKKDAFNPRCTSLDVYRAESTSEVEGNATYYQIKSMSAKYPIVQAGGTSDQLIFNACISDNFGLVTDTNTPLLPVIPSHPQNDWIVVLNPKFGASEIMDGHTHIRMSNENTNISSFHHVASNKDEEYTIPNQYYENEVGSWTSTQQTESIQQTSADHHIPYPSFSTNWEQTSKGIHEVSHFDHNNPALTDDLASDVVFLDRAIRHPDFYSEGTKSWFLLSKTNKIKNGHFLKKDGWSKSGVNSNMGDLTIFFGDIYRQNVEHDGNAVNHFGNETTYAHHRPVMSWHFNNSSTGCGSWYSGSTPSHKSVGNNGIWQEFSLEAGKDYYFQYCMNWASEGSLGSYYDNEHVGVKLTNPTGVTSGTWKQADSNDAIHFKRHGWQGYRQVGTVIGSCGTAEGGWWSIHNEIFTAPATGNYRIYFWVEDDGSGAKFYAGNGLRFKDLIVAEVINRDNPYYGGDKIVIPRDFENYDANASSEIVTGNNYVGGKVKIDEHTYNIESHLNTIFKLHTNITDLPYSTGDDCNFPRALQIQLSKDVIITDNTDTVNVQFKDIGYSSVEKHPFQDTPTDVRPQYTQYMDGRMFVANCKYTSANLDVVERDHNMLFFSELNQPNTIPITNFIRCQDNQGGRITGLAELLGSLVVFMERSIWRLNIPSSDATQWSLLESSPELGCTAPSSIITTKDGVFFANKEGVYLLDQNFVPIEISVLWRNEYQENYNDNTKIFYSPKQKMLYVNQNILNTTWVFDMQNKSKPNWIKLTRTSDSNEGWSGFCSDESFKSYFFCNKETNTTFGELEAKKGTYHGFRKRTGWIRLGDLENTKMIRRVNLRYKKVDPVIDAFRTSFKLLKVDLNIYIDGSDVPSETVDGDKIFKLSNKEEYVSIRLGTRCKYFSIELVSNNETDIPSVSSEIYEMLTGNVVDLSDIFELLTFEVEWE